MLELRRTCWVLGALALTIGACSSQDDGAATAAIVNERDGTDAARPGEVANGNQAGVPGATSGGAGSANVGGNFGADRGAAEPATDAQRPDPADPSSAGDRYEDVGTNPFVLVAHDPLSTFASDVDTASYDIFRRDVEYGGLPQPTSVRLEEYVNFFRYDYPAPTHDASEPFAIHLAAAPHPLRTGTTLLRVGIQGKQAPPEVEGRPANLVYLVDVSGSMQGSDRLGLAQQVMRQSLDRLQPSDTVSIVSYASDTRVRLEPTPVSERATIIGAIEGLSAGGSTAGASGIALAYEQARSGFIEGGVNHVLLCTDGDFNVGPSSTAELLELIRDERRSGVTLTALGFGIGNLNDGMLEAVSNAGNGFYGVITSEGQAAEYVQRRLLSTLSLIARDVKLQVELNPEHVLAYRLLGYENRAIADESFRDDLVDAGEIGAEHQVTALYELVLQGQSVPTPDNAPAPVDGEPYAGPVEVAAEDLALVKVRYKDVDASEEDPAFEVAARLAPSAIAAADAPLDPDLDFAIAVAGFAEILKNSPHADPGALDAIGARFEAQRTRDADREKLAELFTAARPHMTAR